MFAGMLIACLAIAGPPAFASIPDNVVQIDSTRLTGVDAMSATAGEITVTGAGVTACLEGGAAIVAAKLAVIENNAISILTNAHGSTNNMANIYEGTIVLNSIDTGAITPATHMTAYTNSGAAGHLASTVPRATVNSVIVSAYGTAADSAAPAKAKASESA